MADDKKVFDVSKPKASPTSKPVIIGHKSAVKDTTIKVEDGNEKAPIDPLTEKAEEAVIKLDESKLSPVGEKTIEPSDELKAEMKQSADAKVQDESTDETLDQQTKDPSEVDNKEQEPSVLEPDEPVDESKTEPEKEEPKPDQKSEPQKSKSEQVGNESAVNTVLGEAGTAKQQEVQQLEKDEKVKKLVDEGKYVLPIGQPRKHHGKIGFMKGLAIFLVAFIVFSTGMVLAIDAELVKVNIKLPFDLIKKSQPADDAIVTPPVQQTPPTPPSQKPEDKKVEEITETTCLKPAVEGSLLICNLTDLGIKFSYPTAWNVEGVVKVAETNKYETKIGSEEGIYKYDSIKKQWINKSTNKADYIPSVITTNKNFTVYDLGGDVDVGSSSVSGCHYSKLAFEVKNNIVIVDGSTACATTATNPDGSTDVKYTIAQQNIDIENFAKSITNL